MKSARILVRVIIGSFLIYAMPCVGLAGALPRTISPAAQAKIDARYDKDHRSMMDAAFKISVFFRLDKIRIHKVSAYMAPYGGGPWVYAVVREPKLPPSRPTPADGNPFLPGFNPAKAVYMTSWHEYYSHLVIKATLIPVGLPLPAKVWLSDDSPDGFIFTNRPEPYLESRGMWRTEGYTSHRTIVTSLYKPTKPDQDHPTGVYRSYQTYPVFIVQREYRKAFLPAWKFYRAHQKWFSPKFAGKYSNQLLTLAGGKNFYLAQEACAVLLDARPTPLTHGDVFRLLPKMSPHLQSYFIYEIFNFYQPALLAGVSRYVKSVTSVKALLPVALACAYAYDWHAVVGKVSGIPQQFRKVKHAKSKICGLAWPLLQQIKKKALQLGGDAEGIAKIDRLITFAHRWDTRDEKMAGP